VPGSADETGAAGYRPLLFSIAYAMTGSVGDAEDIVQEAFLGLTRARQAGTTIADPKAYLATAVTRLGINYLSSARVRRETYVGDWLPEPVVVAAGGPGPAGHAELADSLSMAFLVLLEALSPVERAVLGRRRQGAGDREAAGPAVARHAAARRPAPPGPGPRRLDPAGLGRRPAERRVVRRQRARDQRGRARRGRRRGQAIRTVVNPGKLGHIGPVSDVARLPPAQNAQFRAPKYGHPANGDPVQNESSLLLVSRVTSGFL
jgi:DNA-directed RNA polymerase specialized sigma24 family protein